MKIESNSAQILVRDNKGSSGVNINSALSGYAADLWFWGGAAYLCKHKDDQFLRVLVVPSAEWLKDIKDGGYEVVGLLSDLSNAKGQP